MEILNNSVQQYAWGKKGSDSKVAKLKGLGDSSYTVKVDETYAEMWMGTHPSGPSYVVRDEKNGPLLKDLIDSNPDVLGAIKSKGDLPFLFKVISINKALSIQAHPDKRLAEKLHAERPTIYKDDNHKPEMAVALSDFEGLCGFRRFPELLWNLHSYPELRGMVSLSAIKAMCSAGDDIERQRVALKKLFGSFVRCPPAVVKTQVKALLERINNPQEKVEVRGMSPPPSPPPLAFGDSMLRPTMGSSTCFPYRPACLALCLKPFRHPYKGILLGTPRRPPILPPPKPSHLLVLVPLTKRQPTRSPITFFSWQPAPAGSALEQRRMAEIFGPNFRGGVRAATSLAARMAKEDADVQRVMIRLSTEYPGDLGILMPLVLNLVMLSPGQSFFMTVDEPHAYLRGDILEVMACSNNVVRAALTPKFRDTNLLVEMLTYNMGAPAVLQAVTVDGKRKRYTPPITDFELEDVRVPVGERYHLDAMPVPGVMVALGGCKSGKVVEDNSGKEICCSEGGVFFLPSDTGVTLVAGTAVSMHVAIAHTNLHWGPLSAPTSGSRVPPFH
ncbi:unnamed protein product [Discosporangium mesarthrocarpum]